jgi:hypothetical protein
MEKYIVFIWLIDSCSPWMDLAVFPVLEKENTGYRAPVRKEGLLEYST